MALFTLRPFEGEPSSALRAEIVGTAHPFTIPCACTGMRGHAEKQRVQVKKDKGWQTMQPTSEGDLHLLSATHTQRSEPCRDGGVGWEGGADLASAGECNLPHLPSTPAQHGSWPTRQQKAARHRKTSQKTARHHTRRARNSSPNDSRKTLLSVKKRMADNPRP